MQNYVPTSFRIGNSKTVTGFASVDEYNFDTSTLKDDQLIDARSVLKMVRRMFQDFLDSGQNVPSSWFND
jgi:hypothetical protein